MIALQQLTETFDNLFVAAASEATGTPVDQLRLIVIFAMMYPLGWFIHYCVYGRIVRHIFVISFGILIQLIVYQQKIVEVAIMGYGAYFIMICAPQKKQQRYVTMFTLGMLASQHLRDFWYDPENLKYEMGVVTYTMLLCCKMQALSFNYKDGLDYKNDKNASLDDHQKAKMVLEAPSFLEITSYIFFCQSCALGIFFEFADYKKWIERTHEYENVPSPIFQTLILASQGFICLGTFIFVATKLPLDYCWSDEFASQPFWYKVIYYFVSMTFKRYFYYGPFKTSSAATAACGLHYNGKDKDGNHKWDKIVAVFIWKVESAASTMEMLQGWNYQVHIWLKHYIQNRLVTPGKRAGTKESMTTFMVSAFWHGFYPFYHVMFFFSAVLAEVTKDVYKMWVFFQWIPSPIRHLLCHLGSMGCMNYFGVMFNCLTFKKGFKFCNATYWFVPIGLTVFLFLSRTLNFVGMAKRKEKKLAGAAEKKAD